MRTTIHHVNINKKNWNKFRNKTENAKKKIIYGVKNGNRDWYRNKFELKKKLHRKCYFKIKLNK